MGKKKRVNKAKKRNKRASKIKARKIELRRQRKKEPVTQTTRTVVRERAEPVQPLAKDMRTELLEASKGRGIRSATEAVMKLMHASTKKDK